MCYPKWVITQLDHTIRFINTLGTKTLDLSDYKDNSMECCGSGCVVCVGLATESGLDTYDKHVEDHYKHQQLTVNDTGMICKATVDQVATTQLLTHCDHKI